MRTTLVSVTAAVCVTLAACGSTGSVAPPVAEPTGLPAPVTPSDAPASDPPAAVPTIDLRERVPETVLGDGWEVSSCDPGDAPLLCVFHDGERVGTIEWLQRPLAAEPGLVADLQTMSPGRALAANLDRVGLYEQTERDRRDNCDGRVVEWERPTDATVGGTPGMVYGYTVRDQDGSPQDVIVSYHAVNGSGSLFVVLIEGLGPRTCIPTEGIALSPDQLATFRPTLDELIANLRLPAPESHAT